MGSLLLGGIITTCDFLGLTVIIFALVHSLTFCNSSFIFSRRIIGSVAWFTKHVSSAGLEKL